MIGDDICWMKFGVDGWFYVINFEVGFFGVVLGMGVDTNLNVMEILWGNVIYINMVFMFDAVWLECGVCVYDRSGWLVWLGGGFC